MKLRTYTYYLVHIIIFLKDMIERVDSFHLCRFSLEKGTPVLAWTWSYDRRGRLEHFHFDY